MVKLKQSFVLASALAFSLMASAAYAQSDASLTASVKTRLAADDLVKAAAINVDTADHVVTLKGTVPNKAVRDRALTVARGTEGVASVVDKLTVADVTAQSTADKAATGVAKGADKSADAVGTAAHKTAGAVDKSKDKTASAAEKTGDALGTAAKKTGDAVETAAKKTGDALGVTADKTKEGTSKAAEKTAEATGSAGRATADASLTAAVKTKLLGDGKTPGLKLDVDTNDGVVTLEGVVPNATAHETALRLARETKGVKRVIDKITVQ